MEYVKKLVKEEREKAAKAGGGPVYTYNTEARAGSRAAPRDGRAAPCSARAAAVCMPGAGAGACMRHAWVSAAAWVVGACGRGARGRHAAG